MMVMTRNEMLDAIEYSIEWLDRYWKSDPHVETSTAYKAYKYVELAAKAYIDISKNVKEDGNELRTKVMTVYDLVGDEHRIAMLEHSDKEDER